MERVIIFEVSCFEPAYNQKIVGRIENMKHKYKMRGEKIMKITVPMYGGMEIEIKAKGLERSDRFNKKDTMAVLNAISIAFAESVRYNVELGCHVTAKYNQEIADAIHALLKNQGCYD